MDRTRYLIVGAGVSGLAFADWIGKDGDRDYLILEAQSEIGGYCKTIVQDGFVWDFSGHFFHFKHKDIERYLVERMGDQRILVVNKNSLILYDGDYIDFPFQKNIHQLKKDAFIDCLVDLFFKEDEGEPSNFQEMLFAKFGKGISERFLVPYNEKLYATDLSRLDVDAMGRFFPYADLESIIRNFRDPDNASYNATFTYPEGGAIQYVKALAAGVDPERICLEERVERIDLHKKVAQTSKGREIAFEYAISAAPFNQLLDIVGLGWDPEIYTWNKVLVFNLGFDAKGLEGVHWVYLPERDVRPYRIGFYDNIFGTDRMSMYVEVGLPRDAHVDDEVVEAELQRILEDLSRVGVIDGHTLVSRHHIVLDPAYVHITRDSIAEVARHKRILASRGVYSIGRYGSWTYCSIEDNIVEARDLAGVLGAVEPA